MVLETEVRDELVTLTAIVTNVLADELWLAMRLPDPRLQDLREGQRIHLTFDRGGSLIVESAFLRRLGSGTRLGMEKSRLFAVSRPKGIEGAQRRAHLRVPLERCVRIKSLIGANHEPIGTGTTINVGVGGVKFRTSMSLLMGDHLRLALVLTPRDIVVVGGTIVRIEDQQELPAGDDAVSGRSPNAMSRVAVRFDGITELDQERIACHILSARRKQVSDVVCEGLPIRSVAEPDADAPG